MRTSAWMRIWGMAVLVSACDHGLTDPPGPAFQPQVDLRADMAEGERSTYAVQLLPSLPDGRWASAVSLNNDGMVVGVGDWNHSGGCRVFSAAIVWHGSVVRNLHAELAMFLGIITDPSVPTCESGGTMALDVNDAGDVLLISSFSGDNAHWIWNARSGFRGAYFSRVGGPISLNNHGEVVGYVDGNQDPSWAAYWSPSVGLRNIDPAEYGSVAFDISDDGWIVGCVRGRLARWRVGQAATLLQDACGEDLGILPGIQARPIGAVTRNGVAALSAQRGGVPVPLLWWQGQVVGAGWATGSASGVSELGRVVGWGYPTALHDPRAITRLRAGALRWLPLPTSMTTSRAYAVNRCGEIAGYALDSKGRQRAAVWRLAKCDEG